MHRQYNGTPNDGVFIVYFLDTKKICERLFSKVFKNIN